MYNFAPGFSLWRELFFRCKTCVLAGILQLYVLYTFINPFISKQLFQLLKHLSHLSQFFYLYRSIPLLYGHQLCLCHPGDKGRVTDTTQIVKSNNFTNLSFFLHDWDTISFISFPCQSGSSSSFAQEFIHIVRGEGANTGNEIDIGRKIQWRHFHHLKHTFQI